MTNTTYTHISKNSTFKQKRKYRINKQIKYIIYIYIINIKMKIQLKIDKYREKVFIHKR